MEYYTAHCSITRILFVVSSNLLHLTSASSATTKNEVSPKVAGSNLTISQVTISDILLALYLLTHLLTASGQPHLFPSAMTELLLESPLPCFLASSTAYALLTSHQLRCQLLPILIASWTFALFVHLVVWLSWIFPRYVSELRHIPTVPGFPLWGQFFEVITQEYGAPQRLWHHQYGPVVRYFFPFGSERLSIAERGALQRMTFDCPKSYVGNCAKPSQAHSLIGRTLRLGLLLDQSSQHDYRSSALALAFSVQSIKTLVPIIWTISLCLGECREETNASGQPNATTVGRLIG